MDALSQFPLVLCIAQRPDQQAPGPPLAFGWSILWFSLTVEYEIRETFPFPRPLETTVSPKNKLTNAALFIINKYLTGSGVASLRRRPSVGSGFGIDPVRL
uniref:Uncharacterized protein n=1 Tax=Spongospora subterranea TaxID=70186 RepID=A0A0H5RAZ8_9EUKA|eukprot:CRZ10981.1 hypothetical protein [Spongospora subterranea]